MSFERAMSRNFRRSLDHGHGATLYQSGLPSTRRLELVSANPLRNGAIALHYRRAR